MKKDTPNKGKLFWTCSTYPFCDFFLWRDEATLREEGLPSGTHGAAVSAAVGEPKDQPPPKPRAPSLTQRPLTSFGVQLTASQHPGGEEAITDRGAGQASGSGTGKVPVSGSSQSSRHLGGEDAEPTPPSSSHTLGMETPCPTPSKRKRSALESRGGGGDAELFSDLDSDDERQLADMADRSAEKVRQHTGNIFATPSHDRAVDAGHGLHTPSVARTLFTGPNNKRQKSVSFEQPESLVSGIPTPAKTPSTSRVGLQQSTPSSSPADPAHDPADEIMDLLRGSNTDPAILQSVQDKLITSARRTKGLLLGRDSARAALKQKDDRIAQLQERVVALENKERFYARQLTNIKAQLTPMPDDS